MSVTNFWRRARKGTFHGMGDRFRHASGQRDDPRPFHRATGWRAYRHHLACKGRDSQTFPQRESPVGLLRPRPQLKDQRRQGHQHRHARGEQTFTQSPEHVRPPSYIPSQRDVRHLGLQPPAADRQKEESRECRRTETFRCDVLHDEDRYRIHL